MKQFQDQAVFAYFKNFWLLLFLFLSTSVIYSMQKNMSPINLFNFITRKIRNIGRDQNNRFKTIIINLPPDWKNKIEECLENGADINCNILPTLIHEKGTPLYYATERSKGELVSYLLDYNADVNACTSSGSTPLHAIISRLWDSPAKFDIEIVEKLLKHRANPNAELRTGHNILSWAAKKGSNDLIKMLIDYGANVNQRNALLSCTPLWLVIRNLQLAKMLCNAGASLVNIDFVTCFSAFHEAVYRKFSKQYFEMFITHVQVDACDKKAHKKLRETVIETLLVFKTLNNDNKFPIIPEELQWYILSYLALDSCSEFNKNFCKQIIKQGHKNHLLTHIVHKRLAGLERILQISNKCGDTALQQLHKQYPNDPYAHDIEPLLNGYKLQHDIDEFNKTITDLSSLPKDNLIGKMRENISETILGQFSLPITN